MKKIVSIIKITNVLERIRNATREEQKKSDQDDREVAEDYTVIDHYFT